MKVLKRDGRLVEFDSERIIHAILLAYESVDGEYTEYALEKATNIANYIMKNNESKDVVTIDEIQDLVERGLMSCKRKDVARAYIAYRDERTRKRNQQSHLRKIVKEKLSASNVQNQNANVDEYSFGGRNGEASSAVNRALALEEYLCDKSRYNHVNNRIYEHDLDYWVVGAHNCLSIPFDDLLAKGFSARQGKIRPAGSVSTAFQLLAVVFQIQSLQQFGGVSATHLDWTMVPYVRKSFFKHWREGRKYILGDTNSKDLVFFKDKSIEDDYYKDGAYQYALDMTKKELEQAVEGMYHNLNTLQSRSGNQLPFTSINYGTCTLPEGRMVIKAILEGSLAGIGPKHTTPIFPCGIFQYWKGVNDRPGTPNYDLYRLALESTSKRLYPNYANVDWTGNAGYDRNDPRTYFSTMGALDSKEHLYIKIDEGVPQDISIKEFFDLCKKNQEIIGRPSQIVYMSPELFLPGKTKNEQDHSIETFSNTSGVYRITYIPQDVSYIGSSNHIQQRWNEHKVAIRTTGGPDCGIKFHDPQLDNYKFEVIEYCENYREKEKYYISKDPNVNISGVGTKYYKNINRKYDPIYIKPSFVQDKTIPQDLIDVSSQNIKVLDIDGKWTKIRHVFKNDKRNTPRMMHIRYQEYEKIRDISCTEDHPLWDGEKFTRADNLRVGDCLYRADGLKLPIIQISWHWESADSYDIGTETGTFIGSDVIMHNCRTANGADINAEPGQNPQLKDGRGNICPVTVILPTLAMEAKQKSEESNSDIVENFMIILDEAIHDAKDMLLERFEWICSQDPNAASFMYDNNTMFGYHPEEGIRSALKHGTIVIGQLGLAEALQVLIRKDHTTDEGMVLAKRIEHLFKDRCAQFKQEYKLNFGVYYTPAENLCYTAMKKFREQYGIIPNVSDREYFTNSMHVPVWHEISPFDKIDIECQLTPYSSAGCITYVELDGGVKNNIDALETIVNYAMDHDIPYFAVNVPNDTCLDCGFTGEFNDHCPMCDSENTQQLRRVTGYLTGNFRTAFNKGKQEETLDRVKHGKGNIE